MMCYDQKGKNTPTVSCSSLLRPAQKVLLMTAGQDSV